MSNYSNNNPYQNNNNVYGNDDTYKNNNHQQNLEKAREKREYKQKAEVAFDAISASFINAKRNKTDFYIDESYRASIVRYFKRYWDNNFIAISFFILIIAFVLSFYTKFASLTIFVVFIVKNIYSQSAFCRYFLNDHNLNTNEIKIIENYIFNFRLDIKMMLIITSILTILSFATSFYSFAIFFDFQDHQILLKFLSKFGTFDENNELFAYVNSFSILVLMLLKTAEKWKK
jgi:DNA segregation ATPase FtsK/SpoIIIE-like protein